MRRQPIYILVNLSSFESNQLVFKCNKIISDFIIECRKNPYSLEEISFCIYQVEGNHLLSLCEPMTELAVINGKDIFIKKTLGTKDNTVIVNFLKQDFAKKCQKTTAEVKGDRKPIVLLLTDCKANNLLCSSINPLLGQKYELVYESTNKKTYSTSNIIPILVAGCYDGDRIEVLSNISLKYNGACAATEYCAAPEYVELPQILKI